MPKSQGRPGPPPCAGCGARLRPGHRFCPSCGAPAASAGPPATAAATPGASLQVGPTTPSLVEDRRLVSVLFADLSGFTSLGEHLDPEDLRQILSSLFAVVSAQIHRYGGTIDKYIGDAVMAVFGAPIAHGDDAQRAVHAALGIQSAVARELDHLARRHGARPTFRIGVNTGEVVAGLLSGQAAYTVVGDTVNSAQRLESAAPPGEILVGETTHALTRHSFVFERVPDLSLKGKSEPVSAYRVLGRSDDELPRDAPPFVGRGAELIHLLELLAAATAGSGSAVDVQGEAGIGKTRLVHQLLLQLPNDAVRLRARCLSHELDTPYALVADLVRRIFGLHLVAGEQEARQRLQNELKRLFPGSDEASVTLLMEVLGYGERLDLDPERKRQRLLAIMRSLLRGMAGSGRLIIVAEDVHWMDPASGALIADLAADLPSLACLLISTSRGGMVPWPAETLRLRSLAGPDAASLVDQTAPEGLPAELRALVLERTGGNPFFIAELVRAVAESREAAVPATVQEVLAARLDSLPLASRRTAQRASVIGRRFGVRLLDRIATDRPVEPLLAALATATFVVRRESRPELVYAFRHALMQEVAYHSQLIRERRALHARVGAAIEELQEDRLEEFVDVLAYHYGRGDDDLKALDWLLRAGDRARGLFANEEALRYYAGALERAAAGNRPDTALAILERVGDILTLTGRYDDALASFRAAQERSGAGRPVVLARLHRKTGLAHRLSGNYVAAQAAFRRGLDVLGDRHDVERAWLLVQIGQLSFREGDHEGAREAASRAIELGRRLGADQVVAQGMSLRGLALQALGELQPGLESHLQSLALYQGLEDLNGIADARSNLGMSYRRMRRWREALEEYRASVALRERTGNLWGVAICHNNIGEVQRTRGTPGDAIPSYERAIAIFEAISAPPEAAAALMNLGAARVESGEVSRGRQDLLRAQARLESLGRTSYLPGLYRYLASAELAAGEVGAAERAALRSLAESEKAKARHQEAMAQRVLAEVRLAQGAPAEALSLLQSSRDTLKLLGEAAELARTLTLLRSLSSPRPRSSGGGRREPG